MLGPEPRPCALAIRPLSPTVATIRNRPKRPAVATFLITHFPSKACPISFSTFARCKPGRPPQSKPGFIAIEPMAIDTQKTESHLAMHPQQARNTSPWPHWPKVEPFAKYPDMFQRLARSAFNGFSNPPNDEFTGPPPFHTCCPESGGGSGTTKKLD